MATKTLPTLPDSTSGIRTWANQRLEEIGSAKDDETLETTLERRFLKGYLEGETSFARHVTMERIIISSPEPPEKGQTPSGKPLSDEAERRYQAMRGRLMAKRALARLIVDTVGPAVWERLYKVLVGTSR